MFWSQKAYDAVPQETPKDEIERCEMDERLTSGCVATQPNSVFQFMHIFHVEGTWSQGTIAHQDVMRSQPDKAVVLSVVLAPAASTPPGNLLERQILPPQTQWIRHSRMETSSLDCHQPFRVIRVPHRVWEPLCYGETTVPWILIGKNLESSHSLRLWLREGEVGRKYRRVKYFLSQENVYLVKCLDFYC